MMGISFTVRDATAIFLEVDTPTHVPGYESNKAKFRGTFCIPADHPAIALFDNAAFELLAESSAVVFKNFFNKEPTQAELREFVRRQVASMDSPPWSIQQPRNDGKYAEQEGMFVFKCTSARIPLFVPERDKDNPGKAVYTRLENKGSGEWFYPGGVYTVKVDVNLFKRTNSLFTYFNGLFWRAAGRRRNAVSASDEEAPSFDDFDYTSQAAGNSQRAPAIPLEGAAQPQIEQDDIPF